ncbi:MAG: sulfotransferase family protein [Polyangiales bacterium]
MSLPPPYRPFGIRAVNGIGAGLRSLGWKAPSLKRQDLLDAAVRAAGSSDFGGDSFLDGMDVFLDAVEREADLNTLGRISCRQTLLRYLENRLRLTEYRSQHPELENERIERPIFIIGLPRTGTTILFNLLSQDPAHRPPLSWEVEWPVPPPETASYQTDPRIADAEKLFGNLDKVIPTLPAIHEFGASLPQECVPINAHEFLTVQFHITYHVPSYQSWFEQQNQLPSYAFHKKFLQHLQSKHMLDRWVLKSPAHLSAIDEILETYPDALIIHTHRDPANVMPSLSSLHYALRGMTSDGVDPIRIGRNVLDTWSLSLQRAVEARRRHADKPRQFFDAYFDDTITDSVDQLRRAYEHFGLEFTESTRERMAAFLAANPRGSRGVHKYTREDFGLDLGEIRQRFGEYCREFDVPLNA